jgi:hypothetical protein
MIVFQRSGFVFVVSIVFRVLQSIREALRGVTPVLDPRYARYVSKRQITLLPAACNPTIHGYRSAIDQELTNDQATAPSTIKDLFDGSG